MKEFMNENNQVHEFGCAMVGFEFPEIATIHEHILPEDIYFEEGDNSFGLETEPHITLLFGIHSDKVEDIDVMEICNTSYCDLILENASLFESKKYDVLKFDCHSETLDNINNDLKQLPHTNDYPEYHAHCTIAYLKAGKGAKYVNLLEGLKFKVKPNKIIYSKPAGEKVFYEILTPEMPSEPFKFGLIAVDPEFPDMILHFCGYWKKPADVDIENLYNELMSDPTFGLIGKNFIVIEAPQELVNHYIEIVKNRT